MNAIRGQSAFSIGWNTGQSSDMYGAMYAGGNDISCVAWLIPNSPWRVIVSRIKNSTNVQVAWELRVVGTNFGVAYRYNFPTSSNTFPTGGYATMNNQISAMLSNGKLILTTVYNLSANTATGNSYIIFLVITFNTDGSIASTNTYQWTPPFNGLGSYYISTSGTPNWVTNACSVNGNKFSFGVNVYGNSNWVVTVDGSSSTLSITSDSYGTNVYTYDGQPPIIPIPNSDGSISMVRFTDSPNYTYYYTRWQKLNAAGNTITPGNWVSAGNGRYNIAAPNGSTYTYSTIGSQYSAYRGKDNAGYFYNIVSQFASVTQLQIQSTPTAQYFTGGLSSMNIVKIRATDNTAMWELVISNQGYQWATQTTSKGVTTTTYYNYYGLGNGILNIQTDSSDNTYILYKTWFAGTGGTTGTLVQTNPIALAEPTTQQEVYNITKVNSSGVQQWTRQIDIGPKSQGALVGDTSIYTDQNQFYYKLDANAWGMVVNESISALEIYTHVGPRNTGFTNPFTFVPNQRTTRAVMIRLSDGVTATYSDNTNISQITTYVQSSTTTVNMYNRNSVLTPITFLPPQFSNISPTTVSNTSYFPIVSRTTSTVTSGSSASVWIQNPSTQQTGTTWNVATY